jgi:hypothetical protein
VAGSGEDPDQHISRCAWSIAIGPSCRHRLAKDRICVRSKSVYGRERKLRGASGGFRGFLKLPLGSGYDVVCGEPEFLLQFFEGRRGTEALHADDLA